MKKIFLVVLIVTIIGTLFSACSVEEQFQDEPDLTSLTGILAEQNNSDKESGSHFLIDEEGEKIPVRSLAINLSSVRYLNNRVEVFGFMNKEDDVFEITGISVVELLSDEREELSEFKEYENSELGFKIKYYDSWTLSATDNGVTFFAPQNSEEITTDLDKVTISQETFDYSPTVSEDGNSDSALSAYIKQNRPEINDINPLMNKIGVDKLDAVKIEQKNGNIEYFLYRFGLIYKIEFIPANQSSDNKEVFAEMLASFRFVVFDDLGHEEIGATGDNNTSEASNEDLPVLDLNLTTFESLPYHFSGKYPSSWYYAGSKGVETNVLHHYSFSDESLTSDNEIISLDVISSSIPSGKKLTLGEKEFIVVESGGKYTVYLTVDGRNYKVSGDEDFEDLIVVMADSISAIPEN